jgi:hypothetical protein
MNNKVSDEEWGRFLNSIQENDEIPADGLRRSGKRNKTIGWKLGSLAMLTGSGFLFTYEDVSPTVSGVLLVTTGGLLATSMYKRENGITQVMIADELDRQNNQ